jgi:FKBP-type peptidyl-prolyl cis-trans isomerase
MSTPLLAALVLGVVTLLATACGQTAAPSTAANKSEVTMANGLKYTDDQVGTGAEATTGKTAVVHYTGWLMDGTKFDSSRDRGQPLSFPLGGGRVIRGWDEGVVGMKVGGKRTLTIPPDLGYGPRGFPPVIPANATLKFEVELVDVR